MSTVKNFQFGGPPANSASNSPGSAAASSRPPATPPTTPPTVPPTVPPPLPRRSVAPGEPYCSNCGYLLKDLVDASKCPECGLALVDVLVRGRSALAHKQRRYRSEATMLGLPIIDVCIGFDEHGKLGRAKGMIAVGDVATGFIAVGNKWATGVVALGGGGAWGLCTIGGGCSFGLLTGVAGGLGVGGIGLGGCGAGGIASGGLAVGVAAQGGMAIGYYARGGGVLGAHTIGPRGPSSQQAVDAFNTLQPFIGLPTSAIGMLRPIALIVGIDVLVLGVILAFITLGHLRWKRLAARPHP